MVRITTLEDTYLGIPLSAFEGILNAARPLIKTKNSWHDEMEMLAGLTRKRKSKSISRIERMALMKQIKQKELEIERLNIKMNEYIDSFCQACLDFRNLKSL